MRKLALLLLALCLLAALPAQAQVVLMGSFGQGAEMLSYGEEGDGAYTQTLLIDGGVLVTTGRALIEPGVNDSLDAVIAAAYPDAYDILVVDMPPVAGYPAERVHFDQGNNEDTHVVDYVYIPTDDWVFYAEIRIPVDWEGEYTDLVETWVASIELFDDGLPDEGEQPDVSGIGDGEEAAPLSWEDLATYVILTDEEDTVFDLAETFAPERFTWQEEAETGRVRVTFVCADGLLVLEPDCGEGMDPALGDAGAEELPEAVLASGCDFVEAQWLGEDFLLYPLRSLCVGDPMDAVIEAYAGGERLPLDADAAQYDELVTYSVAAKAPERGQAVLTYYGRAGTIACIQLNWFGAQ